MNCRCQNSFLLFCRFSVVSEKIVASFRSHVACRFHPLEGLRHKVQEIMLISRIFKSNNRLVFVKFDKKSSEATFCPFNKYENFDL